MLQEQYLQIPVKNLAFPFVAFWVKGWCLEMKPLESSYKNYKFGFLLS